MDGRHADTEPLGNRAHRQETLGPQELRSPQNRRNLLRGRVSIPSIGWILWQPFHGGRRLDPGIVGGLRRPANASYGGDPTGRRFGTKGSQVRILSPRLSEGPEVPRESDRPRGLRVFAGDTLAAAGDVAGDEARATLNRRLRRLLRPLVDGPQRAEVILAGALVDDELQSSLDILPPSRTEPLERLG